MRHFKYYLATAAISLVMSLQALAATASISFSDPTVTAGSDVNVTMKISSQDGTLSRADVTLGYDSNLLQFVSGTDAEGGAGTVRVKGATNGAGTGTLEYNLKFKTLSSGNAAITLSNYEVYDTDEAIAEVTHQGSSNVTVSSASTASNNAILSSLVVSPGTLTPEFSSSVTEYSVIVGTDVNTLAINAATADSGASTSVSGNDNLNMGENNVTITVTAADGMTQAAYNIKVTKQEGGPSAEDAAQAAGSTETVNEGVKLSSKEKTITIMNPGSEVEIPYGFAESTIDIDGHQVKGWVWKEDTEHKYCIVYGMNDAGELNFYRYDLQEKTIQRYFEDPVAADMKKDAESYPEVVERYDKLVGQYNSMFILACVLGGIVLILLIFIIVLITRKNPTKSDFIRRSSSSDRKKEELPERSSSVPDETIAIDTFKRSAAPEEDMTNSDLEMTRVITKKEQSSYQNSVSPEEKLAVDAGLDFEDLDADDDTDSSEEDLGATKAFDFQKEWQSSSPLTKYASTNSSGTATDSDRKEDESVNNGLDIENL
ncbi:cadherin-like beta sandwich domain-containing protein [Oribacterium sp. WCC10]|uniref:cadherin-like beta sandwich domain-containing protein n=1 Tax=Oribacterium sp. WCC10 TaxID=1855343 RepID=UPI0008F1A1AD|nr:cadherin-like beta sandwich domain-containing protein [Oribacterium sp. WCC10]SFG57530.1 Cadherin-like beta sandwich domain-containing protein [Oribacterium sp. WCC10]